MARKGNSTQPGPDAALQAEIEDLRIRFARANAKLKEETANNQKLIQDKLALQSKIEECEAARKAHTAERAQLEDKIKQQYEEKLQQDRMSLRSKVEKKEAQQKSRLDTCRLYLAEANIELEDVKSESKIMKTTIAEQSSELDHSKDEYFSAQLLADCLTLVVNALDKERLPGSDIRNDFETSLFDRALSLSFVDKPRGCSIRTNMDKLQMVGELAQELSSGCTCFHSPNAERLFACVMQCADIVGGKKGPKMKETLLKKGAKGAKSGHSGCAREMDHAKKL